MVEEDGTGTGTARGRVQEAEQGHEDREAEQGHEDRRQSRGTRTGGRAGAHRCRGGEGARDLHAVELVAHDVERRAHPRAPVPEKARCVVACQQ